MNYQKHYNNLISTRTNRLYTEEYFEMHHIIPKCLGGSDDTTNLIKLTAREHLIAHLLLMKMNPHNSGLAFAVLCMSNKGKLNGRNYEFIRKACSKAKSNFFKKLWSDPIKAEQMLKNRQTPEHREKMSAKMKDYYQTEEGKKTLQAMSLSKIGKKISDETKAKISKANIGKINSPECRAKISIAKKGTKNSQEHIENFRAARIGKGTGERNSMASEENRKKVSESKIGRKAVFSKDGSKRLIRKEELEQYHFRNGKYYDYQE